MRKTFRLWTENSTKSHSKSRLAKLNQLQFRSRFELLEERKFLSAVGLFERLDSVSGTDNDIVGIVSTSAKADSDVDPKYASDMKETYVGVAEFSHAEEGTAEANGHAKAAGFILTEVGNSIAVPHVSFEGVSINNSMQGGDGSEGLAHGLAFGSASGKFKFYDEEYVLDPTTAEQKSFYGAIYVPAVGVGSWGGVQSLWETSGFSFTGSIRKNGSVIASVQAISNSGVQSPVSTIEPFWRVYVNRPGHDEYQYDTGGVNLYLNFVTTIQHGDEFTFESSVGSGSFSNRTEARDWGLGGSTAQFNYIGSATAYGFAFETGAPPPLPPIWEPGDDGVESGMFDSVYGPGDLDGDGDLDADDLRLWREVIWKASNESTATTGLLRPLIVTTEEDIDDGDYSFHDLSLREAITLAGSPDRPGSDTIVFAKWVDHVTLDSTALAVDSSVKIAGPGSDKLTVDADGASRVFYVAGTGVLDVKLSGMAVKGGAVNGNGAGIYNASENLTLSDVVVTDNHATGTGLGGGLFSANGVVEVFNSEFYGNSATRGGGIRVQGFPAVTLSIYGSAIYQNTSSAGEGGISAYSATSYIENSTISGNTAGQDSGGILLESSGQMTIINSTIVNNTATNYGGGLRKTGGTVTLHNTIVANNQNLSGWGPTQDIHGPLDLASSYNIFGAGSSLQAFTGAGNIIGTPTSRINPQLAPLGDYGGKTKTHALLTNSPALDKGSNDWSLPYDQRGVGFDREYDLPTTDGGDGYRDIGAFEASTGTTLIVRSDGDRNDSVSLKATTDALRLREAIALSAALAGTEVISFDKTGWSDDEIDLSSTWGQLTINSSLEISNPTGALVTIDAQNNHRVMKVNSGATVSIRGLHLTGGLTSAYPTPDSNGAGIHNEGDLAINESMVGGNYAHGQGGGIYHAAGSLLLNGVTLYENTSPYGFGGGVYLGGGPALITNSTISDNSAAYGGGIHNASGANARVVNSTITLNYAHQAGGINTTSGMRIDNTIVTDNSVYSTSPDIYGSFNSSSANNLIGIDAVTGNGIDNGGNGNLVGANARLKALDYYGGRTLTHALFSDSDAVDNGDNDIAELFSLTYDQRGHDRLWHEGFGDTVDIGAVEWTWPEE